MLPRSVPHMRTNNLGRLRSTCRQRHAIGTCIPKMHLYQRFRSHTKARIPATVVAPLTEPPSWQRDDTKANSLTTHIAS